MKSSRSTSKSSRHFNSYRPLGIIRSLKIELSVLIILDTFFAFVFAWGLLKLGISGWIALPIYLRKDLLPPFVKYAMLQNL